MSQRTAQRQTKRPRQNPSSAHRSGTHQVVRQADIDRIVSAVVARLAPKEVDDVPDHNYSDTDRVQEELDALLDLQKLVRREDIQEHVFQADGSRMTDSNVRYHMRKLANKGVVKKVEERYKIPGLGWRTRDVWSKDTQALLEVLEGKKTVRS